MKRLLLILFVLSTPVLAQPAATPEQQAIQNKLLQEINVGLQCAVSVIVMQQQIAKLMEENKQLKEKANAK